MKQKKDSRKTTKDSLFNGNIICHQYLDGYRFSIDSVLIGHFPDIKKEEEILDLGAGCGVISLEILYRNRNKDISITGLERQEDLAKLARLNVQENSFENEFEIVVGDVKNIKNIFKQETYSLVISNPPFYSLGKGRVSKNIEKTTARHQLDTTIDHFVKSASYCVRNRCRIAMIYPAGNLMELIDSYRKYRIEVKKIQFVYSYPDKSKEARLVLVEGVKNGGKDVKILPPIYIYEYRDGPYTEDIKKMYYP